ncbi:hypothetical protein AC578_9138 [Pseudocercospora eumusae]|uniref:Uncharacterized protein n=1 Tax=Pseudocercospora eumusae TaxID=321146 RepID=A0A139HUZ2_9PEZI|nr:hypothetical protein AC578_9138 [Pseudocercospora eumusae]
MDYGAVMCPSEASNSDFRTPPTVKSWSGNAVLGDGQHRYCIFRATGEQRVFGGRDSASREPGHVISQGPGRSFVDTSTGTTSQPDSVIAKSHGSTLMR